MGQAYGKLTGHSTTYTLLLLIIAAKYTAFSVTRNKLKTTLLERLASLLSGSSLISHLLADTIGLAAAWRVLCWLTSITDFGRITNKQKYDYVGAIFFDTFKGIPPLSWVLNKEEKKMAEGLRKTLKSSAHVTEMVSKLPTQGRDPQSLIAEVSKMVSFEDVKWKSGQVSGAVYHGGAEHLECMNTVSSMYSLSNPLHPDVWPSLRKFEAEIISMTCDFLNGGDENVVGCMTSGGTESILMAVKAHRELGLREYGIEFPEMIIPVTAHAAFDKAAEALRIKLIKLPVDPVTFQVDPILVKARINGNTILIVGSAPNYPMGTIDKIRDLASLAKHYNVGMHVDCCLGGFILPFAKEAGFEIPDFDFSIPGVTSMSCDTHKYGYAVKGTSVVLFRNKNYRHHMYWCYADWTGGLYCTPTMAGSRAGSVSAACWASMMQMGRQGYVDAATKIIKTREHIQAGIELIPGIEVCGQPKAMVVAWRATLRSLNVYRIADQMSHRGWSINSLQNPSAVHLCVTFPHTKDNMADRFLKDLREVVAELSTEVMSGGGSKSDGGGNAPIYGMTASLPKGPVNSMLNTYIDVVLEI